MQRHTAYLSLAILVTGFAMSLAAEDQWVVYEGGDGPGKGKHIVLVAGDDEYRSEEACPMLGKILAKRHGFKCTVLFPIDPKTGEIKPDHQTNIPGMKALATADLMIVFLRFRELPDDQMKYFVDFVDSGKPIIGLRTATHSFNYSRNKDSQYARYSFNDREWRGGFGRQVLGDTWISHHGRHRVQSTRGVINEKYGKHPVLTGVKDIWGPTDVYGVRNLTEKAQVLVQGAVLTGMKPTDKPVEGKQNDPMMPLVWTKSFKGKAGKASKVLCTTMGASVDLQSEDLRRLLVNGCYWGLKMEVPKKANVKIVGKYAPTFYGFGSFKKGVKPADHKLED